jgi:prephenate dehydrogenase
MTFGTVAILGPGLIGGSLALALAERGLADRLVIYSRKDATFPEIKKRIPQVHLTTDVVEAVRGADVVVLCVPIETMAGLVKQFADVLKPTALVTDVGSVKGSVDREIAPLLADKALWIGSHPMAGSEKAGFDVARADLFKSARVVLARSDTGTPSSTSKAIERAEALWGEVGGSTLIMTPHEHDEYVAHISHLPHLAAAALVNSTGPQYFSIAGTGFRDTTRVASGPPDMWAQIGLENREKISEAIAGYMQQLQILKDLLDQGNESGLREELQKAHDSRAEFLQQSK